MTTVLTRSADLGEKLSAIGREAVEGSRAPAVRQLILQAAHELAAQGLERSPFATFQRAYDQLRAGFVSVLDPGHAEGEEVIYPAAETLRTMSGDCDDATALVLALARSAGLHGAAVTLCEEGEDGDCPPAHVYAVVRAPGGEWLAADLEQRLQLGADPAPRFPRAARRELWELEAPAPALGFLGALVGGVASIFGAESSRKAAREQRKGLEAQARATEAAAEQAADAAREQAAVTREAIQASRFQTTVDAALRARSLAEGQRTVSTVLQFLREVTPVVALVVVLAKVAPLAQKAVGAR